MASRLDHERVWDAISFATVFLVILGSVIYAMLQPHARDFLSPCRTDRPFDVVKSCLLADGLPLIYPR